MRRYARTRRHNKSQSVQPSSRGQFREDRRGLFPLRFASRSVPSGELRVVLAHIVNVHHQALASGVDHLLDGLRKSVSMLQCGEEIAQCVFAIVAKA